MTLSFFGLVLLVVFSATLVCVVGKSSEIRRIPPPPPMPTKEGLEILFQSRTMVPSAVTCLAPREEKTRGVPKARKQFQPKAYGDNMNGKFPAFVSFIPTALDDFYNKCLPARLKTHGMPIPILQFQFNHDGNGNVVLFMDFDVPPLFEDSVRFEFELDTSSESKFPLLIQKKFEKDKSAHLTLMVNSMLKTLAKLDPDENPNESWQRYLAPKVESSRSTPHEKYDTYLALNYVRAQLDTNNPNGKKVCIIDDPSALQVRLFMNEADLHEYTTATVLFNFARCVQWWDHSWKLAKFKSVKTVHDLQQRTRYVPCQGVPSADTYCHKWCACHPLPDADDLENEEDISEIDAEKEKLSEVDTTEKEKEIPDADTRSDKQDDFSSKTKQKRKSSKKKEESQPELLEPDGNLCYHIVDDNQFYCAGDCSLHPNTALVCMKH